MDYALKGRLNAKLSLQSVKVSKFNIFIFTKYITMMILTFRLLVYEVTSLVLSPRTPNMSKVSYISHIFTISFLNVSEESRVTPMYLNCLSFVHLHGYLEKTLWSWFSQYSASI